MQAPIRGLTERNGEVFLLDILSHRMSVIDSMTMSAPIPGVELEVAKPTNRLGRKEPNDDHYRSRFPSRVSTNRFAQHHDRRGRGETARTSRRGGEVLPCSRECE